MEMLVKRQPWRGRRVLVTGHTGFKGSWLSLWLAHAGANVTGYSLPAPTSPSLFEQARLSEIVDHRIGDVRDLAALEKVVREIRPEVIFHLAAQPLVRYSYAEPVETYATNVMGTVNLLDVCRRVDSVLGVVCITTDKCYENKEWVWPYRETDPMGGHDPYSSSKGAAEIAISAYRRSYFEAEGPIISSVRAGNVIGGGDWADDRLVPDLVRAFLANQAPVIRSPRSVRPWQHVLEALGGYLIIGERILSGDRSVGTAYNFGPNDDDMRPVGWIVEQMSRHWGVPVEWDADPVVGPHEATLLRLDTSKARAQLNWSPVWGLQKALEKIVSWHRSVAAGEDARTVSADQLEEYLKVADVHFEGATQWA
nr:CDP-glucose 4,6-dehydratase [uncultured Sphingomonas sp.]